MTLRISRSKSNSITFYWSPGMCNQVETLKERSQWTSIHQNSMHYLPRVVVVVVVWEGGGGI